MVHNQTKGNTRMILCLELYFILYICHITLYGTTFYHFKIPLTLFEVRRIKRIVFYGKAQSLHSCAGFNHGHTVLQGALEQIFIHQFLINTFKYKVIINEREEHNIGRNLLIFSSLSHTLRWYQNSNS